MPKTGDNQCLICSPNAEFLQTSVLKTYPNSQESICAGVFFIKVVGLQLLARNFVEKETPAQVNFKNSYFVEHFLAASAFYQAKS